MESLQQAQREEVEQITAEHHTSSQDQARDIPRRDLILDIAETATTVPEDLLPGGNSVL